VSLNEGEKFFNPDIGGNIRRLLFENIDEITARNIEKEIQFIIANYEPRVIQPIDQVLVTPNFDQNSFNVRIQFRIQNVSDPLIVSFQLSQTR
jgi:phage baseplate assembly protein W